jgi:hypothetical protein
VLSACLCFIGVGAALASPCDGAYCEMSTDLCLAMDTQRLHTCCVATSGSTTQCATCTQDLWDCWDGSGMMLASWGPGYNCTNFGAICQ